MILMQYNKYFVKTAELHLEIKYCEKTLRIVEVTVQFLRIHQSGLPAFRLAREA